MLYCTVLYCSCSVVQVFLNKLAQGFPMAAVCILVFDEAHSASRSHPYNKILEDFFFACPEDWRPQLLGLTASPAGESTLASTMTQLCKLSASFASANLLMPSLYLPEMETYTNRATTACVPVTLTQEEEKFRAEVAAYLGQVNIGSRASWLPHGARWTTSRKLW